MRLPKLPKLNIQKLDALKARASALFEHLKPALVTAKDRTVAFFKSIRLPKLDLPKFHISQIFYEPKHEKDAPVTSLALTRTVVISAVGILFCMACLFGLTWAWYTSTVTTAPSTITAAGFDVSATVKAGDISALTADANGWYKLAANTEYSVSLENIGTSSSGFCVVYVKTAGSSETTVYYTDIIRKADAEPAAGTNPYEFTAKFASEKMVKFVPMWGELPSDAVDHIIGYGGKLDPDESLASALTAPAKAPSEEKAETAEGEDKEHSEAEPENAEGVTETPAVPEEPVVTEEGKQPTPGTEEEVNTKPSETPSGSETPAE